MILKCADSMSKLQTGTLLKHYANLKRKLLTTDCYKNCVNVNFMNQEAPKGARLKKLLFVDTRDKEQKIKKHQVIELQYLYALGCSWTEGTDDEEDNQGWVGRLSKKLGCAGFTNFGGSGDSNWHQYQNFLNYRIEPNAIAIFGLSAFSRTVGANGNTIYGRDFDKQYLLKYYNQDFIKLQTHVLIHSFQQRCRTLNIKHLTFVSFDDKEMLDTSYDFIDWTDVITNTTMRDYIGGEKNIGGDVNDSNKFIGKETNKTRVNSNNFSKDGHPNANGYEKWADYLYWRITCD
jgi:hypothetical protein